MSLLNACNGKSKCNDGLNIPEMRLALVKILPHREAEIMNARRGELEAICKQENLHINEKLIPTKVSVPMPVPTKVSHKIQGKHIINILNKLHSSDCSIYKDHSEGNDGNSYIDIDELAFVSLQESFNRQLLKKDEDIVNSCSLIKSELPSQSWISSQVDYVKNKLSQKQQNYLNLYKFKGDVLLNTYIRSDGKEQSINFIEDNYYYFEPYMTEFKFVADFINDFYATLMNIIYSSPPTDSQIVVYRGSKTMIDEVTKGILSTSLDTGVALSFSASESNTGKKYNYINRITIPIGSHCLFIPIMSGEMEIILPDGVNIKFLDTSVRPYITSLDVMTLSKFLPEISVKTNDMLLIEPTHSRIKNMESGRNILVSSLSPSQNITNQLNDMFDALREYNDEYDWSNITVDDVIEAYKDCIKNDIKFEGSLDSSSEYRVSIFEAMIHKLDEI